jgi:hypothetical protein
LREVESAVRSVLEPSGAAAGVRSARHRAKVLVVLGELGISPQDAVAQWWLQLTGEDNPLNLARRAHRSALDAPRQADADFEEFIDTVEAVLDVVLERFETHFHQVVHRLDVLLAKTTPSNGDADGLRLNFPHNQVVTHYFFSRASAAWLGPVRHAGFFAAPPPVEVDEDAGTVQIPAWPVSDYLVRVGPETPSAAVDAALAIPSTDNNRAHHDIVRLALAVPARLGVRLVRTIIEGLGGRFGVLIPHDVGAAVAHFARDRQNEQALELATALLNRMPTDIGPATSVDVYEYAMTLREHIPVLLDAVGTPVLALLASLLDEVIRADAEQRGGPTGRDGSPVWRPTIAGDDRRTESELRHALVSAVRDAATSLVESDTAELGEVVAELASHEWAIFRRLALDLLSRYPERACDLVAARLTDPALIRDTGAEREYLLLAQRAADCLDDYHRRRLLTLIDAGPRPGTPSSVSPADQWHGYIEWAPDEIARWQRDRLAAIQQVLPPEWDARYQVLVAEHGEWAELVEGEHPVRERGRDLLNPSQLGVPVRVVGLLPGLGSLERDLVLVQKLPQSFPPDPDHPLRVSGQVGGEFAQAPAGEGLLEPFGSGGGRRDDERFVFRADQAGTATRPLRVQTGHAHLVEPVNHTADRVLVALDQTSDRRHGVPTR